MKTAIVLLSIIVILMGWFIIVQANTLNERAQLNEQQEQLAELMKSENQDLTEKLSACKSEKRKKELELFRKKVLWGEIIFGAGPSATYDEVEPKTQY